MKTILFDQQTFRRQNYGGISRYFTSLMTGIAKQPGYQVLPKKFFSDNVYLEKEHLTGFNWLKNVKLGNNAFLRKVILKMEAYHIANRIKHGKFDLFHPTYYDSAFLKYLPRNKSFVLTVHDMIHENYFDQMYEYLSEETKHKIKLIPRAQHIIAVSEYTKGQILKYFPHIDKDKISVIYHGTDMQPPAGIDKPAGLPEKYLLFVGLKKHYKNFFWLAESLAEYLRQSHTILVCAGGFDFDTFENDFLSSRNIQQYVKYMPINSDDEIATVYKNAECFIFPSLMEGFGIPILEAFACGCPVILSNSSCFPEIAEDAALYFEPGDQAGLLKKIDMALDEKNRGTLIKKGLERAKLFNWERCIDQHMGVYRSLLN